MGFLSGGKSPTITLDKKWKLTIFIPEDSHATQEDIDAISKAACLTSVSWGRGDTYQLSFAMNIGLGKTDELTPEESLTRALLVLEAIDASKFKIAVENDQEMERVRAVTKLYEKVTEKIIEKQLGGAI